MTIEVTWVIVYQVGVKWRFANRKLSRLYSQKDYTAGLPREVVRKFRMRVQYIDKATDLRDLRALKAHRFEKLKGQRSHQYSMRLNRQYRLILELEKDADGNAVVLVNVEDYH
ncbi:MAG: type II toxin-antitoxin system RelE/ParE family toxin [Phycisphaerae bacterium]